MNNSNTLEYRRYSVPHGPTNMPQFITSEDLHAWSIYRQNLNSDFTDSALGLPYSNLPYGNFQLRDTTVQSILNHPRYGPKTPLGSNMYTYLKFGLPRVFPPNGQKAKNKRHAELNGKINEGFQNGYNSKIGSSGYDSSDNETDIKFDEPENLRKYRSELDFRTIAAVNIPPTNSRGYPNENLKMMSSKSRSEADLLKANKMQMQKERQPPANEILLNNFSSRQKSDNDFDINVQNLEIGKNIKNISLCGKIGELITIMSTSEEDGTNLLECIAGLKNKKSGEIFINGNAVDKINLNRLCAYVPALQKLLLDPKMNVVNILKFYAGVYKKDSDNVVQEKVNTLIDDLGLGSVRTENVSKLTHSEKQRLNVACQMLADKPIILLDKVANSMDIFDTFFLIDYLRQWCLSGKIVIMTLQPPTFEILSMCSSVVLISNGRTIFSDKTTNLSGYMSSLGYPCPPFKNPADYYLDLVTLDDLSAAAMLESSARIDQLINSWNRYSASHSPQITSRPYKPLKERKSNASVLKLIKRCLIYQQPTLFLNWLKCLILGITISLILGSIFWNIPSSDPDLHLNDRLGFYHSFFYAYIPIIMYFIKMNNESLKCAELDVKRKIYTRNAYIITQFFTTLIPIVIIWLGFLLPSIVMSNNSIVFDSSYQTLGIMLLYFYFIQITSFLCTTLFGNKLLSLLILTFFGLFANTIGGFLVHPLTLSSFWKPIQYLSLEKWILSVVLQREFDPEVLANLAGFKVCRNKQIQHQEIIVQHPCPPPNGTQVLNEFLLMNEHHLSQSANPEEFTFSVLIAINVIMLIIIYITFIGNLKKIFKKN